MSAQSPTLTETVRIERLIHGGNGLARLANGRVVFVPWTVPGDMAEITVEDMGKKKPPAVTLRQVEKSSDDRITPRCSVFAKCGGCQWQHVADTAQGHWKREIVSESIRRLGKLPDVPVNDVISSTSWEYRNNVQWFVANNQLGYYQHQSHNVVPFEHCHLVSEEINALKQWLESNPEFLSGLTQVQVRSNTQNELLLVLEGEKSPELPLLQALASASPAIKGVVLNNKTAEETLVGQNYLEQTLAGKTFRVSAQSFFQTNPQIAERLIEAMAGCLPEDKSGSLIDLYTGVGTFAVAFADNFKTIVGVESAPVAIEDARHNIGGKNIELFAGTSKEAIKTLQQKFDTAIIDPPRAGVEPPVLAWISENVAKTLLYVSCDPATLARDLAVLSEAGWQIDVVQPFDMFPQTWHVETLVKLSR